MKIRKTLALAAAGGMLLLPPLANDPADEQSPSETRVSVDHSPLRLHTLPFSVGQVLDYFNEAFGKRPFKIDDKSFVYMDRGNPDEVAIITVSDLEASLGIVLLATGDYGVNYLREFFEAPFLLRPESEQLYMLLDRGPGVRSVALERFNVQMRISEAGRWLVIAVEFSPSELYRPQLTLVTSRRVGQSPEVPTFGKGKAKTMNTLTETSRPSGIAEKGDAVELVPAILKLKSILVPIDFSKISQKALEYAVPIAKQFGAKITLLHAIEPPPYSVDLTYVPMGEGFPIEPMKKELDALAKSTIGPEFLKEVFVQVGTAFEVITNVARDCKTDLIVITTHGHTGLKHVFMGSTAERVVRHAPCPVLVVRKCEHQFV